MDKTELIEHSDGSLDEIVKSIIFVDTWGETELFVFHVEDGVVVLEEVETHDPDWKAWMGHNLHVASSLLSNEVAVSWDEEFLAIHGVLKIGPVFSLLLSAATEWNDFYFALNFHGLLNRFHEDLGISLWHEVE